jgi:hypothetical protein
MIKEYRIEDSNEIVSLQDAEASQNYRIFYLKESDKQIKKIETIEDGVLETINYIIDSFEDEKEIVEKLSIKANLKVVIERIQKVKNLKLKNYRSYSDEILYGDENWLYDSNESVIGWEHLDLITKKPIYEETEKFLYRDEDELLHAYYNADGSLDHIMYMPDDEEQDWVAFGKNNFHELQQWIREDVSYYWDATLLPK